MLPILSSLYFAHAHSRRTIVVYPLYVYRYFKIPYHVDKLYKYSFLLVSSDLTYRLVSGAKTVHVP